jgi:leucine dehydrogenase
LGASCVGATDILSIEADILSPCALGAILNKDSIPNLRVKAIAGGANNQLAIPDDGAHVRAMGILYAPDYVINAGGIINVALQYLDDANREAVDAKIEEIPDRLQTIWTESESKGQTPAQIADDMAKALIGR